MDNSSVSECNIATHTRSEHVFTYVRFHITFYGMCVECSCHADVFTYVCLFACVSVMLIKDLQLCQPQSSTEKNKREQTTGIVSARKNNRDRMMSKHILCCSVLPVCSFSRCNGMDSDVIGWRAASIPILADTSLVVYACVWMYACACMCARVWVWLCVGERFYRSLGKRLIVKCQMLLFNVQMMESIKYEMMWHLSSMSEKSV